MQNVFILIVFMLSGIMPIVVVLSVIMRSLFMLIVVMLNVLMLTVVGLFRGTNMSEKYFGKNLRLCHIELSASNVKAISLIKSSANLKMFFI